MDSTRKRSSTLAPGKVSSSTSPDTKEESRISQDDSVTTSVVLARANRKARRARAKTMTLTDNLSKVVPFHNKFQAELEALKDAKKTLDRISSNASAVRERWASRKPGGTKRVSFGAHLGEPIVREKAFSSSDALNRDLEIYTTTSSPLAATPDAVAPLIGSPERNERGPSPQPKDSQDRGQGSEPISDDEDGTLDYDAILNALEQREDDLRQAGELGRQLIEKNEALTTYAQQVQSNQNELVNTIEELRSEISILCEDNEKYRGTVSNLREALDLSEEKARELQDQLDVSRPAVPTGRGSPHRRSTPDVELRLSAAEVALEKANSHIADLRNDRESLRHELRETNTDYQNEIATLKAELWDANSKLQNLKAHPSRHQTSTLDEQQVVEVLERNESLERENRLVAKQLGSLQAEYDELKVILHNNHDEVSRLQTHISELEFEKESSRMEDTSTPHSGSLLHELSLVAELSESDLVSPRSPPSQTLVDTATVGTNTERPASPLLDESEQETLRQVSLIQQELNHALQLKSGLEKRLADAEGNSRQKLEELRSNSDEKSQSLRSELQTCREKLVSAEAEVKTLKGQHTELQSQVEKMKAKHTREVDTLVNKAADITLREEKTKTKLQQLNGELSASGEKLKQLKGERADFEKAIKSLKSEVARLEAKVKEARTSTAAPSSDDGAGREGGRIKENHEESAQVKNLQRTAHDHLDKLQSAHARSLKLQEETDQEIRDLLEVSMPATPSTITEPQQCNHGLTIGIYSVVLSILFTALLAGLVYLAVSDGVIGSLPT